MFKKKQMGMFKKKQMDGDRWAVVLVSFDGKEEYFLTVFDYEEGAKIGRASCRERV